MRNPEIPPIPGTYEPKSLREYPGLFGKYAMTEKEIRAYDRRQDELKYEME